MKYREQIYQNYASLGLTSVLQSKYNAMEYNLKPHLKSGASLLDIGSGQGEFLDICRHLGMEASGVDVCPELVESSRRRGLKVTLISDLSTYLKTCVNNYDYVSMIDVLEHFNKEEAFDIVSNICSHALHPKGKFIVQIPNMWNLFAAANHYNDYTHECGYTEQSLTQLLKSAGFKEVRLYPQRYQFIGIYALREVLRQIWYLLLKSILLIDQPNRGKILTPNFIAVAAT